MMVELLVVEMAGWRVVAMVGRKAGWMADKLVDQMVDETVAMSVKWDTGLVDQMVDEMADSSVERTVETSGPRFLDKLKLMKEQWLWMHLYS